MQILENNKEIVKHRKSKIQFDLKHKMGVIINIFIPGFVSTNDGNIILMFLNISRNST